MTVPLRLFLLSLLAPLPAGAEALPVAIVPGQGITRGGAPYFVKGAGGDSRLDVLKARGGNSLRTWSTDGLGPLLDQAQQHGLSVCAGIWIEPECAWFSYRNPEHCARQTERLRKIVQEFRAHPALLFWGLGNEQEGDGKNDAYWQQLDRLAQMVHAEDPAHPAFTAVAGLSPEKAAGLNQHTPHLDFVGINTYGAMPGLRAHLEKVGWTRPWVVTEFGPQGFWESPRTSWGAPREQTSAEKARMIESVYQKTIAPGGQCWGSYLFLWGQKQEATPTWFSLFTPSGETTAAVDAIQRCWGGKPENLAPEVTALQGPDHAATVMPGETFTLTATAREPEGEPLTWRWEVVNEHPERDAEGREKAATPVAGAVKPGAEATATITAPGAGKWRVVVIATDGKGHAGTATFPFCVP